MKRITKEEDCGGEQRCKEETTARELYDERSVELQERRQRRRRKEARLFLEWTRSRAAADESIRRSSITARDL